MKKEKIAEALAQRTKLTPDEALTIIEHLIDISIETLASGRDVYLRRLGTLSVKHVPERMHYVPAKGEKVKMPAHNDVVFNMDFDLYMAVKPPKKQE